MLRDFAEQVGLVLGAASACPEIAKLRIDAITIKITDFIKSGTGNTNDGEAILALFKKKQSEGGLAAASKQTDCGLAERQLADLESATPARSEIQAPTASAQAAATTSAQGVKANEIRFGATLPLSGPNKDYGQQIRTGVETAFRAVNDTGGVNGRMLRFIPADDGYETARVSGNIKQLYEKDQVFAFFGNFGTPMAQVYLPYLLEHQMVSFAGYSGANILRRDPPDHYVFNFRPSYAEETDAVVRYLVKIRRIKPEQIAVFAQQDAFGDSIYAGVAKAMRTLRGGDGGFILRLNVQHNTSDVDAAVAQLKAHKTPIKAIVTTAGYRAVAKFIEKTRDAYPGLIYTGSSAVNANSLRDELMLLGPHYMTDVIVTQVVPAADGYSGAVLRYKSALTKYFPGEAPNYVSLEYYLAAQVLIEALRRAGPQPDTEKMVGAFESIRDLDLGLGAAISFSETEHQGSHKIWGSQLTEAGKYETIELQ